MNKLTAVSATLAVSLMTIPAMAKGSIDLNKLINKSDLIFKGEVTDITYKDSSEGLPHTFVTYRMDELIAGETKQKQVTLRFIGGKQTTGKTERYLHVSDVPEFEVGESDVLFVRKNNKIICPLVDCSSGRFRNLSGFIASEDGQPVVMNEKGSYQLSRQSMADQIGKTNRQKGRGRAVSNETGESKITPNKGSSPVDIDNFLISVKSKVTQQRSKGALTTMNFKSSDPSQGFSSGFFKAVAPLDQAMASPTKQASSNTKKAMMPLSNPGKSSFDLWEEEMLRKNGGDPVLGNTQDEH